MQNAWPNYVVRPYVLSRPFRRSFRSVWQERQGRAQRKVHRHVVTHGSLRLMEFSEGTGQKTGTVDDFTPTLIAVSR